MTLSIIVAMDINRVIGVGNQLPWHLPADLKHFKELTMGKPIIMGRKTFASIGKPLPGRRNIVISQQENLQIPSCEVFNSLSSAIDATQDATEVMIIGGAKIFALALPLVQRMYITIIDHAFQGDTFFPEWNAQDWQIVTEVAYPADEKNSFPYRFVQLDRLSQARDGK